MGGAGVALEGGTDSGHRQDTCTGGQEIQMREKRSSKYVREKGRGPTERASERARGLCGAEGVRQLVRENTRATV
jgi:hypothetical protein